MRQFPHRFNNPAAIVLVLVMAIAGVTALQLSGAQEASPPATPEPSGTAASTLAQEQIIVRYKPEATAGDIERLRGKFRSQRGEERRSIDKLRTKVIKVPKADRQKALQTLRQDPSVEFAEPDSLGQKAVTTTNDDEFDFQSVQETFADLMWDKHKGSSGTVVAVVDSGIANHPDLSGQVVQGFDFVANRSITFGDADGHGTSVAGIIAAKANNSEGIAGVCWNCKVMPLNVFDATGTTASRVAEAIRYAADSGVDIINLSLNGTNEETSSLVAAALDYAASKGVISVACASNKGRQFVTWPAVHDVAIGVGGTATDETMDENSSFGQHIDIAAPYGNYSLTKDNDYNDFFGTSGSTPVVSGILAVLRSAFPNATPAQLRTAITSTADPCCEGKINGGRINAIKAYNQLAGTLGADTTKPTVSFTAPAQGATVKGTTPVNLTSGDNQSVAKVHLRIDNRHWVYADGPPFAFNIFTNQLFDGPHKLTLRAIDNAGNFSDVLRNVTSSNNNPNPNPTPTPPTPTPPTPTPPTPTPPTPTPPTPPNPTPKAGDINGDNKVNLTDLSILLSNWNKTGTTSDINKDGKVNLTDLSILLSNWNK